jgi:hypothetical protein
VGTLTFDGNGHLSDGVISQNTRGCNVNCGYLQVSRVHIDGMYTMHPDGSSTFDFCYRIKGTNTWPPGLPDQNVHVIWEASFSLFFEHFSYLQTRLGDCSIGTDPSTWTLFPNPLPNISIGTGNKV